MKRFFALAALVLGLAACQTEPEGLNVNVDGEQLVTVNVTVPEAETRAGANNSALGVFDNGVLGTADDNTTMRYILQVYYNGVASKERLVEYSDEKSVTFDVRLVPGRDYQFVVWADVVDTKDAEGKYEDKHYNTADLANITLNNTWVAMDESRDAFTATELIDNYNGAKGIEIKLYRPFAKLRVVTTDIESLNNLGIVPTKATVTYSEKHYNAFNAFAGKAIADTKNRNIKHENFTIASYGENVAEGADMTLFTDYFFAENDVTQFTLEVFDQNGKLIKKNDFVTDIYVKRNYLTTIKGNILTDGKSFDVTIEDAFAGELGEEDGKTFAKVDTAEELLDAINKGIENITLDGNINLNDLLTAGTLSTRAGATLPFVIAEDKTLVLDLNGFKISTPFEETEKHYYAFENKGTFIIKDSKGDGKIVARGNFNYGTMTLESGTIDACDGNGGYGVRNYEGATFVMNGGAIVTSNEDGDIPGDGYDACPVRVDEGATATINGGSINNISNYTVAIDNYGETTINDGVFTTIHTTIANHSTMTIDGGSFTCNGLEGITAHALWAAAGTTTINGGTFDGKDNYNGFNVDASEGAVVNINGGKFLPVHSGSLYGEGTINVMGGEFFDDPSARVAAGYSVVDNGNGTYTVINLRGSEVEIYGLTLIPDGNNSKIIVNDKEGFLNLTKLFNNWTALFTDGNGTTYTNYAKGAGVDYYYAGRWTVSLEADIDLNNATISPIIIKHPVSTGSPAFEGNNHTIKNAKIATDTATENEAGLFVSSPCGFNDLKLDNIHVTGSNVGNSTAGVLTGSNRVGIDNITITNSSVEGGKYTGGVIGYGYTDVTNCTLTNVSVKGGYKLGGLIGYICASGDNTGEVTGNTLTECSVDGIGNGIYAGGKSEYIIGMLVGNYNCNGTCQDNVVYDMTTTATKVIGKIEAGKVVNESNNIVTYVVENYAELEAALQAGGNIALGADIALDNPIQVNNKEFYLNGRGHKIGQSSAYNIEGTSTAALIHPIGCTAIIENIVFDGIKGDGPIRTVDTKINIKNITVQNCERTATGITAQGLFRLHGESIVTACTFKNNICPMGVSLNWDGNNNLPQSVTNCVFEGNTCHATAVLYYVKGSECKVIGNKFVDNTVTVESGNNAATVYMGFTENNVITGNLFQNNTVNAGTSKRVAGGIMIGYEAEITGNAFIGNSVTGENAKGNDVCASVYYTDIDLSGNYWGGGAPVENDDYFVEYTNYKVIVNDYLTENPIQ